MKLVLFIVAILTTCANELVLGVIKEQDAMKAPSISPATLREKLANVLEPVLTLLYIVVLPLAFIALLCALCVFVRPHPGSRAGPDAADPRDRLASPALNIVGSSQ
jgi:hypothetical protein